ncbi:MAG: hypothetical protein HOQ24_17985 [Mycobacteriaceae bacterium]|nr:hypothetical protein [Mycobacteriaceae bacterium]
MSTESISGSAFEREVLTPHLDRIYAAALRMTSTEAEAESLVETTFLTALAAYRRPRPLADPVVWLFRVFADSYAKTRSRSGSAREIITAAPDALLHRAALAERLDALSDDAVKDALSRIAEKLRLPLYLAEVEGLSPKQISDALRIPLSEARIRVHRARALLSTVLVDRVAG